MSVRDEYTQLLRRQDWSYQFSDDHRVWRAANESMKEIRKLQPDVDPDYDLWNLYAPIEYRVNL